jgi:hypothetical protein
MKVFISWSGERSRLVAELLNDWIQCVIQAVDPWMSSKDIDRGSLWFSEISDALANTSVGIVCLTKENKDRPWILFESGALAKGLSSNRVCTFLIDLEPTDLQNPLAQFNHTSATRNGLLDLVRTINLSLQEQALNSKILDNVFATYWPQFEHGFKQILERTPAVSVEEKRDSQDILVELLSSVRSMDKRMRVMEDDQDSTSTKLERYSVPIQVVGIIEEMRRKGISDQEIKSRILDSNSVIDKFVSDRPMTGALKGQMNFNKNGKK